MGKRTFKIDNNVSVNQIPYQLRPDFLLNAYSSGYFPMWSSDDDEIYWYRPEIRAIFPLNKLKEPRSLKSFAKKHNFEFTIDESFREVMTICGDREDRWISSDMINAYEYLFRLGRAHSIETRIAGELVGGLYGVSIGGAFFGESMFSLVSQASKFAFYRLVDLLKEKNFTLLDSQFLNSHTEMLGAIEIPDAKYLELLNIAINDNISF